MSRILLSFFNGINDSNNINAMPCFYESFIDELHQRGNSLLVYHHKNWAKDFDDLDVLIKQEIDAFNPDFAIIFNNNFYDISTTFDFPIIIYDVDSPLYFKNKESLLKKGRFKFITSQEEVVEQLSLLYNIENNNVLTLPFFSSIRHDKLEKTHNISFIGTRFQTDTNFVSHWNKFMRNKQSDEAIKIYKNIIKYIYCNPFCKIEDLNRKFANKYFDVMQIFDLNEVIDELSGIKRIQTLQALSDLGLSIFGSQDFSSHYSDDWMLPLCYKYDNIYSKKHNQDLYNSSILAVNVNHLQAVSGFSWRVCDIMASDACLLSEERKSFSKFFPNVKIPQFSNHYECRQLAQKLLKNKNMREDIILSCNEIINKKYRFKSLVEPLENFIGFKISGKYDPSAELFIYNLDRHMNDLVSSCEKLKDLENKEEKASYKMITRCNKLFSYLHTKLHKKMFLWCDKNKTKTNKLKSNLYKLNDVLYFNRSYFRENYVVKGFSIPEDDFTWTDGNQLDLIFDLSGNKVLPKSLKLMYGAIPYGNDQEVFIYVNGFKIDEYVANSYENKSISFEKKLLKKKILNLTFKFPKARSPKSNNENQDIRELSLAFKYLVLASDSFDLKKINTVNKMF